MITNDIVEMSNIREMFSTIELMANVEEPKEEKLQLEDSTSNDLKMECSDNSRFYRFLYLGVEKGLYKASHGSLNLPKSGFRPVIENILRSGYGKEVISTICTLVKDSACNKSTLIFVLAVCACSGMKPVVQEAYYQLSTICNGPSCLLEFINFCENIKKEKRNESDLTGSAWGRARRNAVQKWYTNKRPYDVAFAVSSCLTYHHWKHKDLLRLCHIKPNIENLAQEILCSYIAKGYERTKEDFDERLNDTDEKDCHEVMELLKSVNEVKHTESAEHIAYIFSKYKLTWGHLPCHFYNNAEMWKQLLGEIPLRALLYILPRLHHIKVLERDNVYTKVVVQRLLNSDNIVKSGIHPYDFFLCGSEYDHGKNMKKRFKWEPDVEIVSALNAAFHMSFKNVSPTNKRICVTVDTSASMKGNIINSHFVNCRSVAAAMSLIIGRVEPNAVIQGFSKNLDIIEIEEHDTVESVYFKFDKMAGGADCARPMITAKRKKKQFDSFVVFTDAKPSDGKTSPVQAMSEYRKESKISSRLIVVALKSREDPLSQATSDRGILTISGFDKRVPLLINDFISEKF